MATFVFFHAHPDDEAIGTAGTMAAAAQAGRRVVAVFATRGERGEVPADLAPHASLGELRESEARRAGRILGAHRVAFLGYEDSGDDPAAVPSGSFAVADVDRAGRALADLLEEEDADVLVTYDPTGWTKHPDHLQVHRVGRRAADLAARRPHLYETALAVSQLGRLLRLATPAGGEPPDTGLFAIPDAELTALDIRPWLGLKRAALAAHASQIPPESFFRTLSDPDFAEVWGVEYYLDRDADRSGPGPLEAALEASTVNENRADAHEHRGADT